MHVRISRAEPDASIRCRWTGQVTLLGSLPGGAPAPAGAKWQAAIVDDEFRFDPANASRRTIRLSDLKSASAVELPNGSNAVALTVAAGERETVVLLQPVISLLGRRGGRAAALLDALAAWGVPVSHLTAPPMLTDASSSSWKPLEDTIVWSGRASMPGHPWLPPQPAHVWVTTRALRWSIDGVGACRLPLDHLVEAAAVPTDRHPAEAVAVYETSGVRHALPVRFDLYGSDRSSRERGAFLVALKSRGIRTSPGDSSGQPGTLIKPQAMTPHPFRSAPDAASGQARAVPQRSAPTATMETARAVEAALLEDLHRLNHALAGGLGLRRADDLGARLGAGLADLDASERAAVAPEAEIAGRRSRMLALAEATTRLRALIDQRERGLVDGHGIEQRRLAILAPLGHILLG